MADSPLTRLAKLKAVQQLRLASERAELGRHVARTAEATAKLRQEEDRLKRDEAKQRAVLAADYFDPGELRLASLVLEQQQQAANSARAALKERRGAEGKSRQAAAICEAQDENLGDALRKIGRKSIEKADAALAIELAVPGIARANGGKA